MAGMRAGASPHPLHRREDRDPAAWVRPGPPARPQTRHPLPGPVGPAGRRQGGRGAARGLRAPGAAGGVGPDPARRGDPGIASVARGDGRRDRRGVDAARPSATPPTAADPPGGRGAALGVGAAPALHRGAGRGAAPPPSAVRDARRMPAAMRGSWPRSRGSSRQDRPLPPSPTLGHDGSARGRPALRPPDLPTGGAAATWASGETGVCIGIDRRRQTSPSRPPVQRLRGFFLRLEARGSSKPRTISLTRLPRTGGQPRPRVVKAHRGPPAVPPTGIARRRDPKPFITAPGALRLDQGTTAASPASLGAPRLRRRQVR
jgi:hypothetical protein